MGAKRDSKLLHTLVMQRAAAKPISKVACKLFPHKPNPELIPGVNHMPFAQREGKPVDKAGTQAMINVPKNIANKAGSTATAT